MGCAMFCTEPVLGFPQFWFRGLGEFTLNKGGENFVIGVQERDRSIVTNICVATSTLKDANNRCNIPVCWDLRCGQNVVVKVQQQDLAFGV